MDYGYKLTDEKLKELENRIAKVYKDAAKNQKKIAEEYFEQFKARDAIMQKALEAGEITDEYYRDWKLANVGRGKRFEAMRDELAERATRANEVAIAYVNDTTPTIWTLNANYAAYTIENYAGNVGFTLYDENAVERLLVEEPDVMPFYPPKRAVNRGIDLEYGKRQIAAQVTSSILTGDSIGHMADALMTRITTMERSSAIRAARTACTNAMNAGRQMQFEKAASMGIRVQKRWRCVHDARTRAEHGDADGQIRDIDKPYDVGGEKLMFPADSSGSGWNVYNCRCRSENFLPDYPRDMGETYNEWVERKSNSELFSSKEGSIITVQNRKPANPDNTNFVRISDKMFESLVAGARAQGATIIRGNSVAEGLLKNSRASCIGEVLVFKEDVCKTDVHEELRHFWQGKNSLFSNEPSEIIETLREIDAKEYLIKNAKKLKIPRTETEETKKELEYYKKELERIQNGKDNNK